MRRLLVGRVGADHRKGAGFHDQGEPGRGGVGGIADDAPDSAEQGDQEQQFGRGPQFRGLAGDQGNAERAALRVANGTGLCAIALARAAEGVPCRPPFAPAALWWARTFVPSRNTSPSSGCPASRSIAKTRSPTPDRDQRM